MQAIAEVSSIEGHGYGIGRFAFRADAPTVKDLSACATLADLKKLVPDLVPSISEEGERPSYWFNWFRLDQRGRVEIVLLNTQDDVAGKLVHMEIWTGTLPASAT